MSEVACETNQLCNRNQNAFKGFLSIWMAFTTTMAPWTTQRIMPKLQASAVGAAAQCTGGSDNVTCGRRWYQNTWDGKSGMEEQMSATSIFASNLISQSVEPVTATTGGNSTSNPGAGTADPNPTPKVNVKKITMADTVGASILTATVLGAWAALMIWIIKE
jgi:mannan endo-1,6-alpha-mannosidase